MTISTSLPAHGTLTGAGTQDLIRTGASVNEMHTVSFLNYSSSSVTLTLWLDTVANANLILKQAPLAANERVELDVELGTGNKIYAEASAATAVAWTDEMVNS